MANSNGPQSVSEWDSNFNFIVGLVAAPIIILIVIWFLDRKLLAVPYSLFLFYQVLLYHYLSGSRAALQWAYFARDIIHSARGASNVPGTYFVNSLKFMANRLWYVYFAGFVLLGLLMSGGAPAETFSGQFLLTGYEYENAWMLGRGKAPRIIQSFMDKAGASHGTILPAIAGFLVRKRILQRRKVRVEHGPSLIKYQARYWRHMKPIAVWDPFDTIAELQEVMRPEIWAEQAGIISTRARYEIENRKVNFRQTSPLPHNYHRAQEVYEDQVRMAGRWHGVYKSEPYIQAIMVAAYLNITKKQSVGIALTGACAEACCPLYALKHDASPAVKLATRAKVNQQISSLLAGTSKDPTLPRGALLTPQIAAEIDKMVSGHYWLRTAVVACFGIGGPHRLWGGRGPILQPALFGWVRSLDRVLFVALSGVGAETFFCEAHGVIAQFQTEKVYRDETLKLLEEARRSLENMEDVIRINSQNTRNPGDPIYTSLQVEEMDRIKMRIQEITERLDLEPALNMTGPLYWLDALVVHDRNLAMDEL